MSSLLTQMVRDAVELRVLSAIDNYGVCWEIR